MEESKEKLLKYIKQLKSNLDFIDFLINHTQFKYCREDYVKTDAREYYIFTLGARNTELSDSKI